MKTPWMSRVGVIMTVLLLSATMAQAVGTQLLVSNVQAQQRQFTAMWDVTYDLETVGDIAVTVSLSLSMDSGTTYPNVCATVSGDIGVGVLPGIGKHIVWDAGADFPGLSSSTCRLRVTAGDRQSAIPAGFVAIPPGTFMMGSPTTEVSRATNETQHQVTLTHGIYVQATEVTNQQFMDMAQWAYDNGYATATSSSLRDNLDGSTQILKNLGAGGYEITFSNGVFSCINPTHPVKWVAWYGSVAYCDWLSLKQDLPRAYNHATWQCNGGNPYTAVGYRLPTEAEWEYACRVGTQTPFSTGNCLDAGTEANYIGTSPYTGCPSGPNVGWTVAVGSYPANGYGLFDMHGNAWEWCNDWYGLYGGAVTDPAGPATGSIRERRGGGWNYGAQFSRSAQRSAGSPNLPDGGIGFRPVMSAAENLADFVYVAPGVFTMGSPEDEPGHDNGFPATQHQVTLTHGLYVQTTEVTNQQYMEMAQWAYDNGHCTATSASVLDALDGSTQELLSLDIGGCEISFSGGTFTVDAGKANHPVMEVTWYGSVAYCDWLSLQQGLPRAYNHATWQCSGGNPYTAAGYRLPTEAEWEYACRAGTQTAFNTGVCLDAGTEANYNGGDPQSGCPTGPYAGWTVPVGSYPANGYGLFEMHGNVWEWCNDWYDPYGGAVTDPAGAEAAVGRVIRGAGFNRDAETCRSAYRYVCSPWVKEYNAGFRPVRSAF